MPDMDSKSKRFSIIGLDLHWFHLLPDPDGTFNLADRQQLATKYSGIAFSSGAVAFTPRLPLLGCG